VTSRVPAADRRESVWTPSCFVNAHAPHGRACHPRSHASTSTPASVIDVVGLRPSASSEATRLRNYRRSGSRDDHPERDTHPPRELADADVIVQANVGPPNGLTPSASPSGNVTTGNERDVLSPAVLDQRSTPEVRVCVPRSRIATRKPPHESASSTRATASKLPSERSLGCRQAVGHRPAAWDRSVCHSKEQAHSG